MGLAMLLIVLPQAQEVEQVQEVVQVQEVEHPLVVQVHLVQLVNVMMARSMINIVAQMVLVL